MSPHPESLYRLPTREQVQQIIRDAHRERARVVRRMLAAPVRALFGGKRHAKRRPVQHIATLAHAGRT